MRSGSPRRPGRSRNPADSVPARLRHTGPPPPSCPWPGSLRRHSDGNARTDIVAAPTDRAVPCSDLSPIDRTVTLSRQENGRPGLDLTNRNATWKPLISPTPGEFRKATEFTPMILYRAEVIDTVIIHCPPEPIEPITTGLLIRRRIIDNRYQITQCLVDRLSQRTTGAIHVFQRRPDLFHQTDSALCAN